MDSCVDLAFPETQIKLKPSTIPLNPWMTEGLLISRKHKEKLFSKKLRNPNDFHTNNFKTYNRIFNMTKRAAKKSYYDNKFNEFSTNARKTWDTLREVLGSKKKRANIPDYFKNNGAIISGSKDIAEGFNSFFAGIGPKLANSIGPSNLSFEDFLGSKIYCYKFHKNAIFHLG